MFNPIFVAISIFVIFILFNLYIRVRTFKLYRGLVQRRIQFKFNDLFSKDKWQVVLDQYPEDVDLLNAFRKHMLTTGLLFIIVIVVVLILLFFLRRMN
jgi:hypothetical protein